MEFEETLDHYGELIEEKLEEHFVHLERDSSDYHPFLEGCYSDLKEFVLRRGRRIASCSTLITYRGYAGEIDDDILTVCAGIELYRHSILVHDDLVDMDDLRRGERTLHKIHSKEHSRRFGEGAALLSGNISLALAMQAIHASGFRREEVADVLSVLSEHYREVNESQILDLLFEYRDVDVEEWNVMASKRAASLFKTTILTGAILGGAPDHDLEILREAATDIGYSFDIQDDIIDTFAEEEQYGRAPCGDMALGKKPLHVVQALNLGDPEESEELWKFLGQEDFTEEEIDRIRELIRETGGLDAANETSEEHAERANKLLAGTSLEDKDKKFFDSLIGYVRENLNWYK